MFECKEARIARGLLSWESIHYESYTCTVGYTAIREGSICFECFNITQKEQNILPLHFDFRFVP